MRTCKHLKALRGEVAEKARLGGDATTFYASGSRVAGRDAPAPSSTNQAIAAGVALAQSWDGQSAHAGWWLSEKLDGQRCVWDGAGGLWTRTGHEVHAPAALLDALPRGTALDGELWLGRRRFQELMAVTRRQDKPPTWAAVRFMVFDAPHAAGGIGERLDAARAALSAHAAGGGGAVTVHEHEACRGLQHIHDALSEVERAGGEGLMLRHPSAPHRSGRTADVIKVKSRHE
mmetsp:Transcript_53741/g.159173  ORF Transcript_53741/g.159173 Transcript_53741/m.159173 type:complete len:232 (+) Transcript_53741:1500-2195(+)